LNFATTIDDYLKKTNLFMEGLQPSNRTFDWYFSIIIKSLQPFI